MLRRKLPSPVLLIAGHALVSLLLAQALPSLDIGDQPLYLLVIPGLLASLFYPRAVYLTLLFISGLAAALAITALYPDPVDSLWIAGVATGISGGISELLHAVVQWRLRIEKQLRATTEALRQSEALYRSLIEHTPAVTYTLATPAVRPATYVSPQLERLIGVPVEKWLAIPTAWQDHLHPEDRDRVLTELRQARAADRPFDCEYRLVRADGAVLWVHDQSVQVRDSEGKPCGVQGVWTDITQQKALEEQLRQSQKMEGIGRLAGGVAHDFNNILNVIIGYSSILQDRAENDPLLQEGLSEIHQAAERAAALTRQLLAFSRRQVLAPSLLDVNEVILGMEKLLRRLIGEDVELRTLLVGGSAPVMADRGQLEQVLMNLVVNSRDAMPDGGRISIETAHLELDEIDPLYPDLAMGPYVRLSVTDTGEGMDPETAARIFEPFFTTKEQGQGTGLGLAMVYGIVRQSGGDIRVRTARGQGTTFHVLLPRVCAESVTGDSPTGAAAGAGSETILLVEDEEPVRRLTAQILRQKGYTVLEAASGEDALLRSAEHAGPIHLLLTDVVMTGMSGSDTAFAMTGLRPGLRVLYMSGYTEDAVLRRGISSQEHDFLPKPFTPEALLLKVREVLKGVPVR